MRLSITIIITIALLSLFTTGAADMLGIGKTCVFSAVKARITKNGKPLKNIPVLRRWEWNKKREDKTLTDKDGIFTFPAVFEHSVSRLLPIELVVSQGIYAVIDNKEVRLWTNSKRNPEENSEYGGKKIDLSCEITEEAKLIEDYGSLMVTMCKLN